MKAWELGPQTGLDGLRCTDRPLPVPQPGEALVRVHAACLNHRDLLALRGSYGTPRPHERIPLSDGVGTVEAIAGDDCGLAPGTRVIAPHFVNWREGPYNPAFLGQDLGISRDGWLAEYVCLPTAALVAVPDGVSNDTAAALPAAGITAWHALVSFGAVQPGELVLAPGTGGVSIMALQIARALGAEVAITSSSDDKLERCRQLGAAYTVNYRRDPDWVATLLAQTGVRGADVVIDTVGLGAIEQTLSATAPNGRIALIGGLAGAAGTAPNMFGLIGKNLTLKGITSGSRAMLTELLDLVARAKIEPVIDCRFAFDDAPRAFAHLDRGEHMGKVMIRF
ncbi:MAG TPA: NAD(P)-dependent alcohol dehydrogenase [Novosphingobium sp.]|nr:NAD(P)-dependent alcohol dehydrogenase [Novosphingobium sp.]HQA18032.1 NAD(P)-dependent alcohol dehydrogenase [Novosphingobium sp.]